MFINKDNFWKGVNNLQFEEIKQGASTPRFQLTLSLIDAIDLWLVVHQAKRQGIEKADKFVEALIDFAAASNGYTQYLESEKY